MTYKANLSNHFPPLYIQESEVQSVRSPMTQSCLNDPEENQNIQEETDLEDESKTSDHFSNQNSPFSQKLSLKNVSQAANAYFGQQLPHTKQYSQLPSIPLARPLKSSQTKQLPRPNQLPQMNNSPKPPPPSYYFSPKSPCFTYPSPRTPYPSQYLQNGPSKPSQFQQLFPPKYPHHSKSHKSPTQSPQSLLLSPQPLSQSPRPLSQSPRPLSQSPQPLLQSPQPLSQSHRPLSQSPQPLLQSPQPLSQSHRPLSQSPRPFLQKQKHLLQSPLPLSPSLSKNENDGSPQNFSQQLLEESEQGRFFNILYLLKHNADPKIANSRGETPLHKAAQYANTYAIKQFVKASANIYALTSENKTPMHYAIEHNKLSSVRMLTSLGYKLAQDTKALKEVCVNRQEDTVGHLVRRGIANHLINSGAVITREIIFKEVDMDNGKRIVPNIETINFLLEATSKKCAKAMLDMIKDLENEYTSNRRMTGNVWNSIVDPLRKLEGIVKKQNRRSKNIKKIY